MQVLRGDPSPEQPRHLSLLPPVRIAGERHPEAGNRDVDRCGLEHDGRPQVVHHRIVFASDDEREPGSGSLISLWFAQ